MIQTTKGNDESTWLAKIHDGQGAIRDVAKELRYLARAFAITGNATIAEDLNSLARLLDGANEIIDQGVGDELRNTLQLAQAGSAAMLKAVLAGAIVHPSNETGETDL